MGPATPHPPAGWGHDADAWRRYAARGRPVVVDPRAWGRVRWTPRGNVVDVLVRPAGGTPARWRFGVLPGLAAVALLAAVLVPAAALVLALLALALFAGLGLAVRTEVRRGRTYAAPEATEVLARLGAVERIARRHGARHPELAAAAAEAPRWLWALADPDLTPAEHRRLHAALAERADLAARADEELVALDRAEHPAALPASGDELHQLVDALQRTRAELEAGTEPR